MDRGWAESKRFLAGWLVGLALVVWGVASVLTPAYLLGLVVLAATTASFATERLEQQRHRVFARIAAVGVMVVGIAVPALWPAPSDHARETARRLPIGIDSSFVAVPGHTTGYLSGEPRTLDPVTGESRSLRVGSTPRWVVAPGGDLVAISSGVVERYSIAGKRRWRASLDERMSGNPFLTAVTERSVVVASCGRTCALQGIGPSGRTAWSRRVPLLPERDHVLSQVVFVPKPHVVGLLDADTGRERTTVRQGEKDGWAAFGDVLLTSTRRTTDCAYRVRRGARVAFDTTGPCGFLYEASRRGDRITFAEQAETSRQLLQIDLRTHSVRRLGDPSVPERDRVLPDGETLVRTDGRQVTVLGRWSDDARWSRVLSGRILQVSTAAETVVVRVREPKRLMHRRHDRVVVLDARDGSVRGLVTIEPAAKDVPILSLPGAAVVAASDDEDATTFVVGTPRALPARAFPLGSGG